MSDILGQVCVVSRGRNKMDSYLERVPKKRGSFPSRDSIDQPASEFETKWTHILNAFQKSEARHSHVIQSTNQRSSRSRAVAGSGAYKGSSDFRSSHSLAISPVVASSLHSWILSSLRLYQPRRIPRRIVDGKHIYIFALIHCLFTNCRWTT